MGRLEELLGEEQEHGRHYQLLVGLLYQVQLEDAELVEVELLVQAGQMDEEKERTVPPTPEEEAPRHE